MFKAEVIGNLGADAVVKDHQGQKFVTFRVASTYKRKNDDGSESTTTDWIDCTMNNVDNPILPYLRQGVKVFVRGNASLRCYSSPKLKMMVAGMRLGVTEIELCGGSSDDVPRQLIEPETGALIDVQKFYHCNADTKSLKKDEFKMIIDGKGREYACRKDGFVISKEALEQAQNDQG